MMDAPMSPTAFTRPIGPKPPPLTPYRGHPPPASFSGEPARAAAAAAAAIAAAAVGGGSTAGGAHRIPAPPLWEQALEQEKRLRSELRKKSFWEPEVRRLRAALQATYEALLFGHFEFALAAEAEPCLWKAVFYKPIEEFRSRIRALEALVKGAATSPPSANGAVGPAAPAPPAPALASPEEARAQLGRTTGAYLKFLDEALAFYRKMVWKLQWVYGDVGAVVDLDAALQNEIAETVPRAAAAAGGGFSGGGAAGGGAGGGGNGGARVPDVRSSVHRCLIYLGDLCRYQSMALKERPSSARPLWERAMSYYRQAARVLPSSGNPYNQMAVMSYYTSDELRAVYYYFRSLAAELPFATARENLLLLFEKNRNRYGSIASLHAAAALQGGRDAGSRTASGYAADVVVRFVRLHGLLFDRINLDSLPDVLAAALKDLNTFLGHAGCRAMLQKAPEADQMLFHLAVMSVFAVHNVSPSTAGGATAAASAAAAANGNGGGYAATAQRSALRNYAQAAAMHFAAAVANCTAGMAEAAAAGGGVGDVEPGFGAAATACHVMLAWLVANPGVLARDAAAAAAAGGATGGAGGAPDVAAETAARVAFLTAAAQLAIRLADLSRRRAQDQDWQVRGTALRGLGTWVQTG
ncbi:hypothetical protein GPECTOR_33g640 [Gonium pectorale]|uniref:Telomerase activating protein Est1-like N-terminal domain-containing protein n=1 Tax=Gonium pectorale TaxID=33097 RepID=A0A150GD71_GONPE|nr:hypothetical protein GPECTOR_33g640 [Gonium pectorale]|eukprot:KXZ47758.1 hypothetical protein GPECTOR_33g640 [Gonium pectorale]